MRLSTSLLVASSLVLGTATAAADEIHGTVIADGGCGAVVEDVFTGLKYQPIDYDANTMPVGTQVTINGTPETCGSICWNLDFCIFNAVTTLGWTVDTCGTFVLEPSGCTTFTTDAGLRYGIDTLGGFSVGDHVHTSTTWTDQGSSFCFGTLDGFLFGATYDTNCPGGSVGTNYCVSGANSVSSLGSTISAVGSDSLSAGDVTLSASNAPTGMFGMFFYGANQTQMPWGNGSLCVGGSLQRIHPVVLESNGTYETVIDFGVHGANFTALGTVNFQLNYRDTGVGAGFNSSNGLEIVFTP